MNISAPLLLLIAISFQAAGQSHVYISQNNASEITDLLARLTSSKTKDVVNATGLKTRQDVEALLSRATAHKRRGDLTTTSGAIALAFGMRRRAAIRFKAPLSNKAAARQQTEYKLSIPHG